MPYKYEVKVVKKRMSYPKIGMAKKYGSTKGLSRIISSSAKMKKTKYK